MLNLIFDEEEIEELGNMEMPLLLLVQIIVYGMVNLIKRDFCPLELGNALIFLSCCCQTMNGVHFPPLPRFPHCCNVLGLEPQDEVTF